jgi:hypothetical protein
MPHQLFGDGQAFRVSQVQRQAALARVFVVELATHVGVCHAL